MNYMLYAHQGTEKHECSTCGNRICKKVDPEPFAVCTKQSFKYWIPEKEEEKCRTSK